MQLFKDSPGWVMIGTLLPLATVLFAIFSGIISYFVSIKVLQVHVEHLQGSTGDFDLRLRDAQARLRSIETGCCVGAEIHARLATIERQIADIASGNMSLSEVDGAESGKDSNPTYLLSPTPKNLEARWGIGQDFRDVTGRISQLCDGQYPCTVTVDAEDFDPGRSTEIRMELYITFECDGNERSILGRVIDEEILAINCL